MLKMFYQRLRMSGPWDRVATAAATGSLSPDCLGGDNNAPLLDGAMVGSFDSMPLNIISPDAVAFQRGC